LKPKSRPSPIALAALVSVGLSLSLYGGSLSLPFYSDDLLQFPWFEATPMAAYWHTVGPYDDYQPVHFVLWRLLYLLTGGLQPGLARGLNLAGHAVCGALVGLLASRLGQRSWLMAPLASALSVAFPFAFDVVPWASAFCYPLTISLALGAILSYLRAREMDSRLLHLLAVALTGLSGLTYEGGVVTGPTILLTEAILVARARNWRWPAIHLLASAVPLGLIAHYAPVSTHWLGGLGSTGNLLVGLQSLAFPVAPLATLLERVGVGPRPAMAGVGVVALLATGWVAHRIGHGRAYWFGLGWAVLWSIIPLVSLRFNWERDPLRVLYPVSVGAAVLWSAVLGGALPRGARCRRLPIPLAVALASLVPSLLFVRGRMDLWQRSGQLLWQVVLAAEKGEAVLSVNLPGRITPRTRLFPLGHEGVIPLPPPTNTDLLVRVHTGQGGAAFERVAGAVLPSLPYTVELAGPPLGDDDLRAAGRVLVLAYQDGAMSMEEAGAVVAARAQEPAAATFGGRISLLSISCCQVGPARVELRVRWQALEPMTGTPTVFAHLVGDDGALLAQADGQPLRGLYPLNLWQPGEVVHDVRTFDAVPSKPAAVLVGIWEPGTGARWEAAGSDGQPLAEDALRCAVEGE